MELAGVIIGSIVVLVTVATGGPRLYHFIRFRKPVFTVHEIQLPVEEKAGQNFVLGGDFVLNVRGAAQPVTLTKWQVMLFRGPGRSGGGLESQGAINIPPFVWTRIRVPSIGMGLGEAPPPHVEAEIYLSNPRDLYIVPITLELSEDGSKYNYRDWGYAFRHLRQTVWRHPGRLRRFLRAVSRGRVG